MPELQSAKEWVKCSDYRLKVEIVHSLWIGMMSLTIMMIHSLMAGAMMDRSWRGEILQQNTANRKVSSTSEELKDQTC